MRRGAGHGRIRRIHRLRLLPPALLAAGAAVSAAAAVRIGVHWVIDPLDDVLVGGAGLLLAAGIVAVALHLLPVRPFRTAAVLAAGGGLLVALTRVIAGPPSSSGGRYVAYGPGTPPSISRLRTPLLPLR